MVNKKGKKKNGGKRKVPKQIKPTVLANNASPSAYQHGPKRRPSNKSKRGGVQHHHVRGVCSVTDPFCPASKNSKWPDGTSGNTMTEQFRGNAVMSSSTSGNGCAVLAPAAPYGLLISASSTASTVTMAATYALYTGSATSMLATYGQSYRIVSMGAILRCVASATNASGVITLGTTGNVPISTVFTLGQEYYDELQMKAIQPGMELSWIAQPKGTEARAFKDLSTATVVDNDWTNLVIELSGCPVSISMIMVEWFVNVEFILKPQMAIASCARQNPAKSASAETAVSKVHQSLGSFIEGGVKQVEQSVMNHASQALSSLMSDPLDSIASLFEGFL